MNIQIIRAPNGEELVVLSRADYEALLAGQIAEDAEDAADIAMFDQVMTELSATPDAILPAEVSAFISRGDRRLKAIRRWRGLSQVELSDKAGIAQGYLSEIESGRKAGAGETIDAIAAALEVPRSWID